MTGDVGTPGPGSGVRLGVDAGDARVGLAVSDPGMVLATPVETVGRGPGDLARIVQVAQERQVAGVVVGKPTTLAGRAGPAVEKATAFAERLQAAFAAAGLDVPVRLVDERLTTVSAERTLTSQGVRGARRRQVVDQAAAVVILQHALDTERATGRPAGQQLEPHQ